MVFLDLLKLPEELVVLAIGKLWPIENVVLMRR